MGGFGDHSREKNLIYLLNIFKILKNG